MKKELKVNENPWWSPTRIKTMESCKKKYFFEYVLHLEHKVPSAAAAGKHNHKIIEKMWLAVPGTKNLVKGYKSYESCVNVSLRDWKFNYARTGETEGRKIEWGIYDGNGWGKRFLGRIAETAGLSYTRSMNEKPRLRAEIEMKAEFEGIKIMSIADELRDDLIIRDHKSGSEQIKEYFVKNNFQMTLCSMCLFLCLQKPHTDVYDIYPEYRKISLDEFLDLSRVEINDVYPRTNNGIHNPTSEIYSAKRTGHDFNEAIQAIQCGINSLKERDFHPSKENCDFCVYKKECNNYNTEDYFKNEYAEKFPLFASSGIILDSYKPRLKKQRLQKSFRFGGKK